MFNQASFVGFHRRRRLRGWSGAGPVLGGIGGALALIAVYVGIIAIAESPAHALEQLRTDAVWVALVAAGFGTQAGLYVRVRQLTRSRTPAAAGALTGAGTGTSTAGMIACCAHHLADLAPLVGLAGATAFFGRFRLAFILGGLAVNLVGVAFSVKTLRRVQAHLATRQAPGCHEPAASDPAVERGETQLAKDPVCGMEVAEHSAAATAEYQGSTYYFCAPGCKRAFEKDPARYVGQDEGQGSHGHHGHHH